MVIVKSSTPIKRYITRFFQGNTLYSSCYAPRNMRAACGWLAPHTSWCGLQAVSLKTSPGDSRLSIPSWSVFIGREKLTHCFSSRLDKQRKDEVSRTRSAWFTLSTLYLTSTSLRMVCTTFTISTLALSSPQFTTTLSPKASSMTLNRRSHRAIFCRAETIWRGRTRGVLAEYY